MGQEGGVCLCVCVSGVGGGMGGLVCVHDVA